MPAATQQYRPLCAATGLGPDRLLHTAVAGSEELSRPFRFALTLLAPVAEPVDFARVLGRPAAVGRRLARGRNPPPARRRQPVRPGEARRRVRPLHRRVGPRGLDPFQAGPEPHVPAGERAGNPGRSLRRVRHRAATRRHLPPARPLRAVPRERPGVRLAAHGRGGDLLLLRPRLGRAHAGAGGHAAGARRAPRRADLRRDRGGQPPRGVGEIAGTPRGQGDALGPLVRNAGEPARRRGESAGRGAGRRGHAQTRRRPGAGVGTVRLPRRLRGAVRRRRPRRRRPRGRPEAGLRRRRPHRRAADATGGRRRGATLRRERRRAAGRRAQVRADPPPPTPTASTC